MSDRAATSPLGTESIKSAYRETFPSTNKSEPVDWLLVRLVDERAKPVTSTPIRAIAYALTDGIESSYASPSQASSYHNILAREKSGVVGYPVPDKHDEHASLVWSSAMLLNSTHGGSTNAEGEVRFAVPKEWTRVAIAAINKSGVVAFAVASRPLTAVTLVVSGLTSTRYRVSVDDESAVVPRLMAIHKTARTAVEMTPVAPNEFIGPGVDQWCPFIPWQTGFALNEPIDLRANLLDGILHARRLKCYHVVDAETKDPINNVTVLIFDRLSGIPRRSACITSRTGDYYLDSQDALHRALLCSPGYRSVWPDMRNAVIEVDRGTDPKVELTTRDSCDVVCDVFPVSLGTFNVTESGVPMMAPLKHRGLVSQHTLPCGTYVVRPRGIALESLIIDVRSGVVNAATLLGAPPLIVNGDRDYGALAFTDRLGKRAVCSSQDHDGRYKVGGVASGVVAIAREGSPEDIRFVQWNGHDAIAIDFNSAEANQTTVEWSSGWVPRNLAGSASYDSSSALWTRVLGRDDTAAAFAWRDGGSARLLTGRKYVRLPEDFGVLERGGVDGGDRMYCTSYGPDTVFRSTFKKLNGIWRAPFPRGCNMIFVAGVDASAPGRLLLPHGEAILSCDFARSETVALGRCERLAITCGPCFVAIVGTGPQALVADSVWMDCPGVWVAGVPCDDNGEWRVWTWSRDGIKSEPLRGVIRNGIVK